MIPPILIEAVRDRRLKGAPFTLLCFLHTILEYGEYRRLKHLSVAEAIGVPRRTVSQSMHILVDEGYLRSGDKQERNVGTYMLLNSRGEAVKQSA